MKSTRTNGGRRARGSGPSLRLTRGGARHGAHARSVATAALNRAARPASVERNQHGGCVSEPATGAEGELGRVMTKALPDAFRPVGSVGAD